MPAEVEETDPEGVDYTWVMQTTFVLTIVFGSPLVALIAYLTGVALPTWTDQALFAIRVGAVVWFVTAIGVFVYAKRTTVEADDGEDRADGSDGEAASERGGND